MDVLVANMLESWMNGNRREVVARIGTLSPWNAARVAALLAASFNESNRDALDGMLAAASGHDECVTCGLMFHATPADEYPICHACASQRRTVLAGVVADLSAEGPAPVTRPRRTMEMGEPGHPFSCKGCGCYLGPGVPDGYCMECYPGPQVSEGGAS